MHFDARRVVRRVHEKKGRPEAAFLLKLRGSAVAGLAVGAIGGRLDVGGGAVDGIARAEGQAGGDEGEGDKLTHGSVSSNATAGEGAEVAR